MAVDIDLLMNKAKRAAAVFAELDQEQTDGIVKAVSEAALDNRVRLAKMAHEETGMGIWRDKVIKNVIASQLVYESIKGLKTVGVINEDEKTGITEIAQPLGPILGVVPVTNPTSTVIFKILISLKTRNPIIIKPHRNAVLSSNEAARICYEAAVEMDAPEDCIQLLGSEAREETQAIMAHRDMALILATGGGSLVRAAYSSGTPAIGVGAGNVPVYVEKSADVPFAARQIFESKTFDHGTACTSEQAIVTEKTGVAERFKYELEKLGAYFLSDAEVERSGRIFYDTDKKLMNPAIMGRSVEVLARAAGISVPSGTRLLVAQINGVGPEHPLSYEILAPIIAFYTADGFDDALKLCIALNFNGGIGHTASIFSNDDAKIRRFAQLMNAGRIVVNQPSTLGGAGGISNSLEPSFTLGCGTGGKNITTDNISARHLLNIQRIARRRNNERFTRMDAELYLDESLKAGELTSIYNLNY